MLFISSEKLILFSRYLTFCLTAWSCIIKGLIKKIKLISKFYQLDYTYCPISTEVKGTGNKVWLVKPCSDERQNVFKLFKTKTK